MTMPVSEDASRDRLLARQSSILAVFRASGGRLWMIDLVFELRRRGISVDGLTSELRGLNRRGLVRGPLSRTLVYELTVDGWDTGRPR